MPHFVQIDNNPLLLFNALSGLGEVSLEAHNKDIPFLIEHDAEAFI